MSAVEDLDAFYAGFKRVPVQRPELKLGDRVIVTAREHPHYGETGTITKAPRMVSILGMAPGLWLEMQGDWEEFGVKPNEVRRIEDLDERPTRQRRGRISTGGA